MSFQALTFPHLWHNGSIPMKQIIAMPYYRWRGRLGRWHRLLFISPAEARLINLMGGRVYMSRRIVNKNGFGLTFVLSLGKTLRHEKIKREVRVGKCYVDFGAMDIGRGLEVDGKDYHRDVVAEFDRDSYLYQRNWRIMHIEASQLWRDPDKVQRDVLKFLLD